MRLKTNEIGSAAKRIGTVMHLWRRQSRACVRTQGINSKGIVCLLDDVVLGVQALRQEPLQEVVACSFLVVLARKITRHLTMKWPPRLFLSVGGK